MTDHVLRQTKATIEIVVSLGYADVEPVTFTVKRADGTTLTSGNATKDNAVTGRYFFDLAPQTELDSLTITWTGTFGGVSQTFTTFVEIVGGHIFSVAQARAYGDKELNSATKYPESTIRTKRVEISELFEKECGVSFFPRFHRETLDGSGTDVLRVSKTRVSRIIALTVDGAAVTGLDLSAVIVYPSGKLVRSAGWRVGNRNVVIAYEHGWTSAPGEISDAGLALARYELVNSDVTDRAITVSNDLGTVRLSTPGAKFPTGLPIVDSTLVRYDERAVIL